MKTLKLEVGKTYRSREGEEVKIVENDGGIEFPYLGNNGEWYTENGRYNACAVTHRYDLIEEAPKTSRTFDIPNSVKKVTVSQEGNRIIVEMVPEDVKTPKPGDVLINKQGNVYIFKSVVNSDTHAHCSWLGKSGSLAIVGTCNPGRPATPEEAQPLWDALKKAGKRWNPEALQVEEIPEIDRIREWVDKRLEENKYKHESIAEVIEAYLNYKEGKK